MYPVALDLTRIRITLVGSGETVRRRLEQLRQAGATQVTFHEDHLPEAHEIRQSPVLMVTGFDDETSAVLASIARLQGVLVNVEDKPDLCDFYFMSHVKRGSLTLAISTGGASPTLAQEIKAYLAQLFGEEWKGIVSALSEQRLEWKRRGLSNKEVGDLTRDYIRARALLIIPRAGQAAA